MLVINGFTYYNNIAGSVKILWRCTIKGCKGTVATYRHGCQMAKFDSFLSLDCARVEGVGAQSKERKGSNFAIWQPYL